MTKLSSSTYHTIIRRVSELDGDIEPIVTKMLDHPIDANHVRALATHVALDDHVCKKLIGHKALNPENTDGNNTLAHSRQATLQGMVTWGHGESKQLAKHRLATNT
jgi:hypothetical protein